MGKKGGSIHLKREKAPSFWSIPRKKFTWAIRPSSGPHDIGHCFPLALVVRDILGLADTRRETKIIISQSKIKVDGKIVVDDRFPIGLMDVISIAEIDKYYRVLPHEKGLILNPIPEEETLVKLCRIEDKKTLKNGTVELNLHDGRNLMIKIADPKNPEEDSYSTLDTLLIKIPKQEIMEHLVLKEGMIVTLIGGANIGKVGTITSIIKQTGQKRRKSLITIEDKNGESYQTILNYAFVVGAKKPHISLSSSEAKINV